MSLNLMKLPIALFVYNRLAHTQTAIEALLENDLRNVVLYVFSDGPRTEDKESVFKLREYLDSITGFEEVMLVKSDVNKGLAKSIIDGVSYILESYDSIIVLEDDLVVSRNFIDYMKDALLRYKNENRVMSIGGYSYPLFDVSDESVKETYFLKLSTSWGWATWRSSWNYFEKNADKLLNSFTKEDVYDFNIHNSENFWRQVILNKRGVIDTWAVFWYATIFKNDGLTLYPKHSLVRNIGHDGSGTNCGISQRFDVDLNTKKINYFETDIRENLFVRAKLANYFRVSRPFLLKRMVNFIKRHLG